MRTLNATIAKRLPLPPNHSAKARRRFAALESAPLFLADWMDVLFIHYRVDRERLQATVPFELDGLDGDAYVSLVAFSMRRLRPAFGGALTALPFKIIGETRFLNVRTYVRQDNDPGIYFMKEFMSSRLSAPLGPITYGLPYHFARLDYNCRHDGFTFDGRVRRTEGYERRLRLTARIAANSPGEERRANSEERRTTAKNEEQQRRTKNNSEERRTTEFLTEKYTAYTCHRGRRRLFRIWHDPWPLREVDAEFEDHDLLQTTGDWMTDAQFIGAQYSPGARNVWMGPPHLVRTPAAPKHHKHRHAAFLELP